MKPSRTFHISPSRFIQRCLVGLAFLAIPLSLSAAYPFFDDFESGLGNWIPSGSWGLTTAKASSPTHAVTDSPGAFYTNNTDSALTLASSVSLAGATRPALGFQLACFLEDGYDYGFVEVSTNGGATWINPPIGAVTGTRAAMSREQLDLSPYTGSADFRIRFHLVTDSSVVMDGCYIDDVRIAEAPDPVMVTATQTNRNSIALVWTVSASTDFGAYRLYRSPTPGVDWHTARVVAEIGNAATTNVTDITVSPKSKYYYRVAVVNTNGMLTLGNEIQVATPAGMDYPFLDNGEGVERGRRRLAHPRLVRFAGHELCQRHRLPIAHAGGADVFCGQRGVAGAVVQP